MSRRNEAFSLTAHSSPDGDPKSIAQSARLEAERATAREEAIRSNEAHAFAISEEAERRFAKYRAIDPFPDIPPALLNSADVIDYVLATGMISPFYPDRLKTASYGVALLGPWRYVDEDGQTRKGDLARDQTFTLRANSIAFMTVEPRLQVPDYIGLRHNLKINQVYRGLLVGTGPLIDPGFVGRLSLPLHNLTQTDYELVGGEEIIWIEFTKLSPVASWRAPRKDQMSRVGAYPPYRSGSAGTRERTIDDYIYEATTNDGVPSSSVSAIAAQAREAVRTAESAVTEEQAFEARVRRFNFNGAIGVAVAIAALIVPLEISVIAQLISQSATIAKLEQQVVDLQNSATESPAIGSQTTAPSPSTTRSPKGITPTP